MYNCEFCNKNYSSKSVLNTHQKTTKKCLALRIDTIQNRYTCEDCNYTTERKGNLSIHLNTCKIKIQQKYSLLEKENKTLHDQNKTYY